SQQAIGQGGWRLDAGKLPLGAPARAVDSPSVSGLNSGGLGGGQTDGWHDRVPRSIARRVIHDTPPVRRPLAFGSRKSARRVTGCVSWGNPYLSTIRATGNVRALV